MAQIYWASRTSFVASKQRKSVRYIRRPKWDCPGSKNKRIGKWGEVGYTAPRRRTFPMSHKGWGSLWRVDLTDRVLLANRKRSRTSTNLVRTRGKIRREATTKLQIEKPRKGRPNIGPKLRRGLRRKLVPTRKVDRKP